MTGDPVQPPDTAAPRRSRVLAACIVIAALCWLLVATVLVPWILRGAWEGRSIALLNRALEGRATHPFELYLGIWHRFALRATAAMGIGLVVVLLARRFGRRWSSRLFAVLHREPAATARDFVLLAVAAGCAGGIAEAISSLSPSLFRGVPRQGADPLVLWLAPLATTFIALGVALLLLVVRARGRMSLQVPAFIFTTGLAIALIRASKLGIGRNGTLLLAAGIAVQVTLLCVKNVNRFRSVVRVTAVAGVVIVALAAFATTAGQGIRARLRIASLPAAPSAAPNVIFLILDTVRAESLSLYGYERETSPEIEEFASGGVTFDAAIAPVPWTLPSHASMFTGRQPWELSTDFERRLDDTWPTLAETLSERGYATVGIVANDIYCSVSTGLDRGFDRYFGWHISLGTIGKSSRWTRDLLDRIRPRLGIRGHLGRKSAETVNDEFMRWLDHRPDRPFFAFLNYYDAHNPYETHPPFATKFTETPPRFWELNGWERRYTGEALQGFHDAYDSAIGYLDFQVGRLLDELRDRDLLDNSIVVIVSDHGEHLGEHGILLHANSLYMPLLHVPLVIRYPARVPAGVRIAPDAGLVDLPATVLELLGTAPGVLPGRSLTRFWTGDSELASGDPDPILVELTPNPNLNALDPIQRGHMTSLVRGKLHYIRNGDGIEELYDIAADPAEERDLSGHPEWRDVLLELRTTLDSIRPPGTAGAVAAAN